MSPHDTQASDSVFMNLVSSLYLEDKKNEKKELDLLGANPKLYV